MIRVDSTDHSHVVKCSQCPPFARLALSKTEALRIGADHEQRVHRDVETARDALRKNLTRRAAV